MEKFLVIGERIHCISPAVRRAIEERNPAEIIKRAIRCRRSLYRL